MVTATNHHDLRFSATRITMQNAPPARDGRQAAITDYIQHFLTQRQTEKAAKVSADDIETHRKLDETYRPDRWLPEAARRASQIKAVTHTTRFTHPEAGGTGWHYAKSRADMSLAPPEHLVGTHSLATGTLVDDTIGNAAALDVQKFLKWTWEGHSLLDMAQSQNPAFLAALGEVTATDEAEARRWSSAFAGLRESPPPASDTLARQVYFPLPDRSYHLLAPLGPTSLLHGLHRQLSEDRFGEPAKAARTAAREKKAPADGVPGHYHEYPNLLVQKHGGSKPQNISQLNSERRGELWLLASTPPQWIDQGLRPPLKETSIFGSYLLQFGELTRQTRDLRDYLGSLHAEDNDRDIRQKRRDMVDAVVLSVLHVAALLQSLEEGWSAAPGCGLNRDEKLWLDPGRPVDDDDPQFQVDVASSAWPREIARRFGLWLNAAIQPRHKPSLGDPEQREWARELRRARKLFMRDAR